MKTFENITNRQVIAFGNSENGCLWSFQNTDNQYQYNYIITPNSIGKELPHQARQPLQDQETGCSYFGARYLDHTLTTSWLTVDPMADKYPSISPYAYCAWNPIKLVDPEGEKIVFVNGYLGFGSPNGGKKYWGDSFISGAKSFFHDNATPYFTNVEHGMLSTAAHRQKKGYEYAKVNYASLIEGMEEGESFKLVSHSMGGAFAMGMKEYLEDQGWNVESMVFINTYQCDKIKMKKTIQHI